ncbi:KDP operon transcriptional regulatory protein KdpE [Desulfosporosinus acididurans]|uniref:Stage 0 sporulation protein A homolog n=1 Tax=Desulfosporosinus acididurans TaxID=476652 RepID=A0A0J1FLR0_9FIRM|nr:response regulator [Desulfosporosinus acididurans]KLU64405.1 KDP operon transcriptional regulatory protein KdpE [Desulfosporosinus acididurans]
MNEKDKRILVIDDEPQILRLLKVSLAVHGYEVYEANTAAEGFRKITETKPDLIVLDLGLPDSDGIDVITKVRESSKVPVVVLTAREHENDKVLAFDLGADDYVTKPFSMGELLARIRNALRHSYDTSDEVILKFGDITINLENREVRVNGNLIKLTPIEYQLLTLLAQNKGKILTHHQLLSTIWGPHTDSNSHYLRIYIGQLRKKLENDPSEPIHLITEPGIGYKLV